MSEAEVEAYLHTQIPLSAAMGVRVVEANAARVHLRAPLAPNLNHRQTVFGGSLSTLAILAAWTLAHLRLRERGMAARLVIQRGSMEYLAPAAGAFDALCVAPEPARWERFVAAWRRHGRGRIALGAEVLCNGAPVARFDGEFVALPEAESG